MKNLKKNKKIRKYTRKYTRKYRGGQSPQPPQSPDKKNDSSKNKSDELGSALANGYISILEFIKNKMARFAGLKSVYEEESSGPSLALAERGAEMALNGLNMAIQNPNVKAGVALASEKLATTLQEVAKVAREKLDDPEFQETLLLLVKFLAEMTAKFLDAISNPLNRSIDKYTDIFEKMIRKLATAIANAILDFMKAIPFMGEAVAFVSLLHTIAMFIFSFIEAFYKTMTTTANFVGEVADNLNPSPGSTSGFSKIKSLLQQSIDKYTNLAKANYQDLKTQSLQPNIDKYTNQAKEKYQALKTQSLQPNIDKYKNLAKEKYQALKTQGVPADTPTPMKGGKKIQKRLQKSFRDYYKTNKTKKRNRK